MDILRGQRHQSAPTPRPPQPINVGESPTQVDETAATTAVAAANIIKSLGHFQRKMQKQKPPFKRSKAKRSLNFQALGGQLITEV